MNSRKKPESTFKRFATRRPFAFALVIILLFIVVSFFAGGLAEGLDAPARQMVFALGSLSGALIYVLIMWRFGWLSAAGITRLGTARAWLMVLPAILFAILKDLYVIFGDFGFAAAGDGRGVATALYHLIDGGLFQEFAFRGVILYAFVRLWGDTTRGLLKSVLASAVLFSLIHSFNLLFVLFGPESTKTVAFVLLQMAETLLSGVALAIFVLFVGSVWPAVVYHGLVNAFVNVRAQTMPDFSESIAMWAWMILLHVPVVVYALFLLRRTPPRPVIPNAP